MEGYLEKKSPKLAVWQKRYFICFNDYLAYFQTKVDLPPFKPQGIIQLSEINKVDYLDPNKNEFIIQVKGRDFVLLAESKEIKEQWLDALRIPFDRQPSKGKFKKVQWNELSQDQITQIYLEREKMLEEQIKLFIGHENQVAMKAKRIESIYQHFGIHADEFIYYAFIHKISKKNPQKKKKRWLVLFSSVNYETGQRIIDLAQHIPDMYKLDTIYMFKFQSVNDGTTFTKFQGVVKDIQKPQILIDDVFSIKFTINQSAYQFFFYTLGEIKRLEGFILKIQEILSKQPEMQQYENRTKKKFFSLENRRLIGKFAHSKILYEGQLEMKINHLAFKNATVRLQEDSLYWYFIDSDVLQSVQIGQMKSVERNNRILTIFLFKKEPLIFKSASVLETQDWYDKLKSVITVEEVQVQAEITPMRNSLMKNTRTSLEQQTQRKEPINHQQQKPGFFEQFFCWGNERQEIN